MRKIVIISIIGLFVVSLSWAEPVTVENDSDNPVPVAITNRAQTTLMSGFKTFRFERAGPQSSDVDLVTIVPEGKIFVLTDLLAVVHEGLEESVVINLLEGNDLKYREGDALLNFNLTTGIVFATGSHVHIKLLYTTSDPKNGYAVGSIFFSGYLINEEETSDIDG